ncbi:MAG TPA: adenylosuccinate lyase [Candidatus Dormibacteraeota bacterium]
MAGPSATYNSPRPLIERYSPPRMREIWSDRHRFDLWLRIEILACEAWSERGRVPADALPKLRRAGFDVERIRQVEESVGHDVIAFLTVVGETVGQPEARWLHLGLTSSDVVDTAFALQVKESAALIDQDLGALREACAALALEHRQTPMVGRTHGIHAEPITFGFKVAGWVAELDRARRRLAGAAAEAATGKLSGAVGTHATVDPEVEEYVCGRLGLQVDEVSTQVVSRDRHAAFLNALAVAAASMERIALEIRHLQRSEVSELREPFGKQQKGSSAMPHKRNPVLTERICGLARVVRGYAATELENVALWHERDISHSSAERVIFPDACALVDYMALQLTKVVTGLDVNVAQMRRNLDLWGGVVFSQRVLLALVEAGLSREHAYALVQRAAHRALDGEGGFRANLLESPEVRERIGDRLDELFDPAADLQKADVAFERIGLLQKVKA